jgi:hypothetical protein
MKNIMAITFAACILVSSCGQSLEKKEDNRVSKMLEKFTTVCQLTPEQAKSLKPALETFIKNKVENKDKYASDQGALRKADSLNRTTYIDSLKKILTPDQLEKFKAAKGQFKMNKQDGGQDAGQ